VATKQPFVCPYCQRRGKTVVLPLNSFMAVSGQRLALCPQCGQRVTLSLETYEAAEAAQEQQRQRAKRPGQIAGRIFGLAVLAGIIWFVFHNSSSGLTWQVTAVKALNDQQVDVTVNYTNPTSSDHDTSNCGATITDPNTQDFGASSWGNGPSLLVPAGGGRYIDYVVKVGGNDANVMDGQTGWVKVSC